MAYGNVDPPWLGGGVHGGGNGEFDVPWEAHGRLYYYSSGWKVATSGGASVGPQVAGPFPARSPQTFAFLWQGLDQGSGGKRYCAQAWRVRVNFVTAGAAHTSLALKTGNKLPKTC